MSPTKQEQSTASATTLVKDISSTDILLGRGGASNLHPGNQRYHNVLKKKSVEYVNCQTRKEKTQLTWKIFADLSREGVRFLRKDKTSRGYIEAEDFEVRRKISQRLRELALKAKGKPHGEWSLVKQRMAAMKTNPEILSERKEDVWEPLDPWAPNWSLRSLTTSADWGDFLQGLTTDETIEQDEQSQSDFTAEVSLDSVDHECKLSGLDSFRVPVMAALDLTWKTPGENKSCPHLIED